MTNPDGATADNQPENEQPPATCIEEYRQLRFGRKIGHLISPLLCDVAEVRRIEPISANDIKFSSGLDEEAEAVELSKIAHRKAKEELQKPAGAGL